MSRGVNDYDAARIQGRNVSNANSYSIVSPGLVTDGLALHLDAGNFNSYPAAGTVWYDLSDRRNNGTLVNGPTFTTENGGSIVFDGTNDYATSTFAFTANQGATISGWLYSTATTSAYRNFIDSNLNRPMIWWNTTGQIEFDIDYTTPSTYRNQWVYVTFVKPSGFSTGLCYVNGAFLANTTYSYSLSAGTPTWFNRSGGQTWIGRCALVTVHNRALTPTEIEQNFNATRARFGV